MTRHGAAAIVAFLLLAAGSRPAQRAAAGLTFVEIAGRAGLRFTHHTGAFGKKYLPETLGAGAVFFDVDHDGWQDVLLVKGTDWPGREEPRGPTARLFRCNAGRGRFVDVTAASGLDVPIYGMGGAAADYDNDGRQDVLVTAVGQNRLFRNAGGGRFVDVTDRAGLGGRQGFSTSALWMDYDRDGLLDLVVCNYVRWTPADDVFCSADGRKKAYCTPEAYRGETLWLFGNLGNGTFRDVTAAAGLFDPTSKALGVTMIDYDLDDWPDLFVANDTQPNKLYRNRGDGTFVETGVQTGVAFSEDGRARAGMGSDAADYDNSGVPSFVVTNFSGEMVGLYRPAGKGQFEDRAPGSEVGQASRLTLGFGCFFFDADLDGLLDLLVVNGHIDDTLTDTKGRVHYAEPPHLLHNGGSGRLVDVGQEVGAAFAEPKVGRGAAFADVDLDGGELRHILFTLQPLMLESQGLAAALESMAEKMGETYNQHVIVDADQEATTRLEMSIQAEAFYIAEEAVSNARQHAKAAHVWVRLKSVENDIAMLEIEDDGVGFEPGSANFTNELQGSLGLVTMRARAKLINGVLNIDSAEGRGTRVRLLIPLTDEARQQLHRRQ